MKISMQEMVSRTCGRGTAIFSNLKADAGISPIAGLGTQVSPVIPIAIEDQTAPDVTGAPVARNHSQDVLTDALAIYSIYDRLAPSMKGIKAANDETANAWRVAA